MNDIAISLLERSCFLQAFDTFKEALKDDCSLEAAREREKAPEAFPKPPPIKYATILISELTTMEKNVDSVFEKLQDDAYNACFLPVRFGESTPPVDLQDAVVEYNYGLSQQAYTAALSKKRKRIAANNHAHLAIGLLQSADLALEKISSVPAGVKTSGSESQVLFLRLALLLSLHKSCVGTQEEEGVKQKLIEVHTRISTMFETMEASHAAVARMHSTHRQGSIDDTRVKSARTA